jgi:hypothetical protein
VPNVRSRALRRALLAALLLPFADLRAQAAPEAESYPARCGTGAPASEGNGYVPLPRGDVFCPLLADPKAIRSFVTYQRGNATDFANDIAAVGIADQFGFFRAGGTRAGDGVQLGVAGAVFAQFDIGTSSYDLLNADYLIALPLSFRHGGFSGRARIYHQSSHLGDEVILRPDHPERENLSFESVELLLSQDVDALRVYAGGEYFFRREPVEIADRLVHAGVELRQRSGARLGTVARARLVAAADVKVVNDSAWRTGGNVRAGFEVGRPRDNGTAARRWSLLGEYYDGPSPYGQFHRSHVRLTGIGFDFTL